MIFGGLLNFISSGADIDIEDSCSTEGFARMEGKRSMSLECALYIQMRSLSLKSLESRMELLEDLPHDDDDDDIVKKLRVKMKTILPWEPSRL
jgi:hypothetical protein